MYYLSKYKFNVWGLVLCGLTLASCNANIKKDELTQSNYSKETTVKSNNTQTEQAKKIKKSKLSIKLEEKGLVALQTLDSSIKVDLKYSTTNNFLQKDVYGNLHRAYLQPAVAKMLVEAHQQLKQINANYRFLIFDAVRPRHIQKVMWEAIRGTEYWGKGYLSNPARGSIHNFGAAVDLTIINTKNNKILNMGTPFDTFSKISHTDNERSLLKTGKLTEQQLANRKLLRQVMRHAGFSSIPGEWWHFNACSRRLAKQRYDIIP